MPLVGVIMESASDEPVVKDTIKTLEEMGIDTGVDIDKLIDCPRLIT